MQVLTAGATGAAAGTAAGVSQAEVDAYIAQLEAEFGAGGAAAGGGAALAGTVGLVALDVGLLAYDAHEAKKLLCAYGIGCGNPSPSPNAGASPVPQPSPGPGRSPAPKPPMAGRKSHCGGYGPNEDPNQEPGVCLLLYQAELKSCLQFARDLTSYWACTQRAYLNYIRCLQGQEPLNQTPCAAAIPMRKELKGAQHG
jgi:hypothetical protein